MTYKFTDTKERMNMPAGTSYQRAQNLPLKYMYNKFQRFTNIPKSLKDHSNLMNNKLFLNNAIPIETVHRYPNKT